jgi:Fur family ferric uptake transcriptional regulator
VTRAPEPRHVSVSDLDEALELMRRSGRRVSAPARLVLEALFSVDGPVSAEYVASGLGGTRETLDVVSVYRNLERLGELGLVSHVHLGHGPGLYALVRGRPREYFVCDRCTRVTSVDAADLDRLRAQLEKTFGYQARFDHFPIHGYCPSCAGEAHSHGDEPHAHEHSHGDFVHSHPHVHETGVEEDHAHPHEH